ncbi:class I SAM-dependent methyltransferase [Kibdelosporangium aridum]|uniref:class I SAM-dependent methyltransferase n=1 Tax=Kibdelosporangium aridum TaxID=2030 RepID=UPI0035E75288
MNDINRSARDEPLDGEQRSRLKSNSTFVYNIAASVAAKGDIWNWGMHDSALAEEMESIIPGCLSYDTDGVSEQLYFRALRSLPLYPDGFANRTIIEVGCGIGEGLNFLSRLFPTARFIGLDLSPMAIQRANALTSRGDVVKFTQGDAESLPFEDGMADIVINIESSHNYPSLGTFFKEVERVLKPGGHFSHIDIYTDQRYQLLTGLKKAQSSLQWLDEDDISPQVRNAIRKRMTPGSHFQRTFVAHSKSPLKKLIERHARAVVFGSEFAGFTEAPLLKILRNIGWKPAGKSHSLLPVRRYLHNIVRKGVDQPER